jgi:hypothetical protein
MGISVGEAHSIAQRWNNRETTRGGQGDLPVLRNNDTTTNKEGSQDTLVPEASRSFLPSPNSSKEKRTTGGEAPVILR